MRKWEDEVTFELNKLEKVPERDHSQMEKTKNDFLMEMEKIHQEVTLSRSKIVFPFSKKRNFIFIVIGYLILAIIISIIFIIYSILN